MPVPSPMGPEPAVAMIVTVGLSPRLHAQLADSWGQRHRITAEATLAEAAHPLTIGLADALVVHPAAIEHDMSALELVLDGQGNLPLIVYGDAGRSTMQAVARVRRLRVPLLMLEHFDDSPEQLRAFLASLPPATWRERVFRRISDPIRIMPLQLRLAIRELFSDPRPSVSPAQLAASAGMTRRTLDRWVDRAGLTSTRILVTAPNLVDAFFFISERRVPATAIAARCGLASARTLMGQLAGVTRLESFSELRRLPAERFLGYLATALAPGTRRAQ